MTKQLKHLHVYIVHQFAQPVFDDGLSEATCIDHKILGVYLNKDDAECHRFKLVSKDSSAYFSRESPYIAVTKHTVRGKQSKLLGIFSTKGWKITTKGHTLFNGEDFQ